MPLTDTERQKPYRDGHERDPAVKNRLAAQYAAKKNTNQQPRKSRPFFDNLYNRNVRDVDI